MFTQTADPITGRITAVCARCDEHLTAPAKDTRGIDHAKREHVCPDARARIARRAS